MKKRWLILLLVVALLLLECGAIACIKYWPKHPSEKNCPSGVYKHYAQDKNLDVTFVMGFSINDTLKVTTTLLTAKNETGWTRIADDFSIMDGYEALRSSKSYSQNGGDVENQKNMTSFYFADHDTTIGTEDGDLVVSFLNDRVLYIFHEVDSIAAFAIIGFCLQHITPIQQ